MSDYHDLFLALELPGDLPAAELAELRWLLGETEQPAELTSADWESWGYPWPVLAGNTPSHGFDGTDVSLLLPANRVYPDGGTPWALTVRVCIHEDEFGMAMEVVEWLLRLATTEGWVGFLRYSGSDEVQHLVRHRDGFDLLDVRTARRDLALSRSF
ncbi:hypothetical protein [Kitasatospora camelliae]|uniref:Uncharacterized protein n=1 Tax=Kitasatospora camelliae TaxID=3156397 RepID=A0AAU8JPS0_9ACTN